MRSRFYCCLFSGHSDRISGMGIYTCRKCGEKYESNRLTDGLCDKCAVEYMDKYHQVREYLWNHPGVTASVIAKECGCNVTQVMQWVKEDRFMVSNDSRVRLYCEICGKAIMSGRYCADCQSEAERRAKAEAANARIKEHMEQRHGTSLRQNRADGEMRFLNNKD